MTCPCCKSKMNVFLDSYQHCDLCELIVLEKNKRFTCKDEYHHYNQHNNSLDNSGYVKMFKGFLDFVSLHVKVYTSVLDFGSGKGEVLSKILTNEGKQVVCYDKYFHDEDIYKKQKYDLITSTEVFEHLSNPLHVMKELSSLLKEDGYIAIMTNFHTNKKEEFAKWWYPKDPTHITFYTLKSFEILAKKCALHVKMSDDKKIVILSNKL